MRIVISAEDMRRIRFHEDAIARLAVAAEALTSVGNTIHATEVARIRDEVVVDYTKFLAGKMAPAAIEALEARA